MKFAPGNQFGRGGARPGAGRKTLKVRRLCLVAFAKRIRVLCQIADDKTAAPRDRIAAIALLAKIGLPAQHKVEVTTRPQFHPIDFGGAQNEGRN